MNHLSIELALPRPYPCTESAMTTHSARLISGQNGAIMEILPEFEYFRDVSRIVWFNVSFVHHSVLSWILNLTVPSLLLFRLSSTSNMQLVVQRRRLIWRMVIFGYPPMLH